MIRYRVTRSTVMLLLFLCGLTSRVAAQSHVPPPGKTMTAVRINPTTPRIDGLLDDEVWQHAPAFTGFMQREPNEGQAATESTTVRLAYDNEALYVGVMAYDRTPEKIVARLARRDQQSDSDRISVDLDPYHDHQTGYWFAINAAGTLDDGAVSNDTEFDKTWDGVWEARCAIHAQGWSAEFKIPYHVLRFSPKDEYVWGINVLREITHKKEKVYWVMVPRNESGWVSRFGHLTGISGIHPPTHLEVLPYMVARRTYEPKSLTNPDGRASFSNVGGDIRYGITSNISLNATINPDFGQVEADPAVLNLSFFETFFQERRPFFVEGASTFQTPLQLFYSRRIGRRPGYFSTPAGTQTVDRPDFTTILGAAKLTGKTARKTTFGLLGAVTSAEDATVESITGPLQRRQSRIEPLTNYTVGRIQQDVGGNSNVGLLMTAVNRDGAESAYTSGMDWNVRWHRNTYAFSGQAVGSQTGPSTLRQRGYGAQVEFARTSGWFQGRVQFRALSPGLNVNDLGFIRRVNIIDPEGGIELKKTQPWGPFRRLRANVNGFAAWNYRYRWAGGYRWTGGDHRWVSMWKGMEVNLQSELKNFWQVGGGRFFQGQSLIDLETRGGPLTVGPAGGESWAWLESDSRKRISVNLFSFWGGHVGGSRWRGFEARATLRPVPTIELSAGPSYNWNFIKAQWITNVDDDGDRIQDHYIFGELTSRVLDVTTRANVTFSRNLSLQLYLQPFVAVGDYGTIKELARPSSYDFTPYSGLGFNPDFNSRSLRSNMVLRWEYRPGSTLFLVWSQSRSAFSQNPTFRPFQSLRDSFSDKGPNIYMIKLNYWLSV